jgi:DNA-binding MarR family transcriptional regulator
VGTTNKDPYLDPSHSMGYLSRLSFRAFSRALEKKTLCHGVSSGQWRFLRVLWETDDITQRELSELVGTKEPTTVRSIRSLEASGFITRRKDRADGRKSRIKLTAKSRKLRTTLMPYVIELNQIATQGISKQDVETARRVLIRMQENLKEE